MAEQLTQGVFLGRTRVTRKSNIGGARHVFAQIKGLHNELVFAPWGGVIQNPFRGAAKIYAADLFNIVYDDKCENPKLYVLKTYKVVSVSGTTVNIEKTPYSHIPFVGDKIGVAPAEIGGDMTAQTVIGKKVATVDGKQVWALTMDAALDASADDVLVEADEDGKMLVKDINAAAPCDYDFVFEPVADPDDEDDFDNAEYELTPVVGVVAYTHRMSALPECVLKLNESKWNGIFRIGSWL